MPESLRQKNTINIAVLNRRVTVQKKIPDEDNTDGKVREDNWADFSTVWAAKRDRTPREIYSGAAVNALNPTIYIIRHNREIKPSMRLIDTADGLIYNITGVVEDYGGNRRETHLYCEAIQNG